MRKYEGVMGYADQGCQSMLIRACHEGLLQRLVTLMFPTTCFKSGWIHPPKPVKVVKSENDSVGSRIPLA